MVSGDNQTGPAGAALQQPVVVKVTDANGLPVWNHSVSFVVIFDGVQNRNDVIAEVRTDYKGEARATWTLGVKVGLNFLEVRTPGLRGSPVTFRASSFAGAAYRMLSANGDNQNTTVGETSAPLVVRITDQNGNPVKGTTVTFRILRGDQASLTRTSDISDDLGNASTRLRLGLTTGEYWVEATSERLYGAPVIFHIKGVAGAAKQMTILSGNDQVGTINRQLPLPLEVSVVDINNNPKPNVPLNFVVSQGGGAIAESQPVSTDEQGIARVNWTIGSRTTTNGNEVTVINNSIPGSPLIFRATGVSNNNFPRFNDMPLSYTIKEREQFEFTVTAIDDDGDALTYSAVQKPIGSNFGIAAGKYKFVWRPEFNQAGLHKVVLKVEDGKGGFDQATVTITVQNLNRAPELQPHPARLDTNITINATQRYWVNATDPDGDPIYYLWTDSFVGGNVIVSSTNEYIVQAKELGSHIITLFAYDLADTVKIEWRTIVKTSVQLASFTAQVSSVNGVRLEWETSTEVENSGFNVLRSISGDGEYEKLNASLIRPRRDGHYSFEDKNLTAGRRYYYMLEDVDLQGNVVRHGPIVAEVPYPQTYNLSQNYPNPFNPETTIGYQIPEPAHVQIIIFNLMGQVVRVLVDENKPAGYYSVIWNGRNDLGERVSTGIYWYQLQAGKHASTKKMLLTQ
jgi:hypothetical protein